MDNDANLLALLKSRFGYESFLPLQSEIIGNVLARRDSLALMPTGGGKSLCYQLPALVFGGVTLVVSPLIALMKDQVDALNANGIAARFINSSLPAGEVGRVQAQVLRGQIKLLYVAPERLALPGFRRFLHGLDLSLIAIDEAHCISEWGHEFRPDYRNLRQLRDDFPATPVIALTATATQRVRDDIIAQLGLQQGRVFLSSFDRSNLSYWVWPRDGARERLLPLLERHRSQSAIIYCFSRQETETLAADLNARGLPARAYHAGLDSDTRRRTQEDFVRDRVPIIVATIAFGMGIDKPDVRLVVHHNLPKSLEGYYQETGRAGRDGLPSQCVLIYSYADKVRQDYFINQIEDAQEQRNAREKLARMVEFAQLTSCRRRFMLEYLGERRAEESCGGCDVCLEPREEFDATEIAQKVLSAVIRTGERFGANHVIQVLTGSREKRVLEMGHERLSVHGIARDYGRPQLREIIGLLQERGLLVRSEGEYPTLAVAPEGRELLRGRQPLSLPRPIGADGARAPGRATSTAVAPEPDATLFEELRALRRRLAVAQNVPPYVVFGDVSLRHMAAAFPQSMEAFSRIPGVGEVKLEQYGPDFLAVIRAYAEANGLADRSDAAPLRQPSGERARARDRERRERRLGPTHDATRELLSRRLSIAEMAQLRGVAETTIVGHLELLAARGDVLDLAHLLPAADRLSEIEAAFEVCGSAYMRPVRDHLGEQFTYDELRLVRMHLRQQGRLPEQETPPD